MGDAVSGGNPVAAAEHFRQHGGAAHLARAHYSLRLAGMRLGLKGNSQKALVEIYIEPFVVGPDGIAGMVGGVGLGDHPVYAAEAVDQVVVGALAAHVLQQRFPQTLQNRGVLRFKRRLATLRGVVDNTGRLSAPGAVDGGGASAWKRGVESGPIGHRQTRIDAQSVAVKLRIAGLFDLPDRNRSLSAVGRRPAGRDRRGMWRFRLARCELHQKGDKQQ